MAGLAENILEREGNAGRVTRIECTTTVSPDPFTIEVYHAWSPIGAERFVDLVKDDYFTGVAFFRCVKNFLVQFGILPDASSPKKAYWRGQGPIPDDPTLGIPFKRGTLSFAGSGPNTRGTQLFITFADIPHLGSPSAPWETPLGVVTDGMEKVVDKLFTGYGDQKPFNKKGIDQGVLQNRGNVYIREEFPLLSLFKGCKVVAESPVDEEQESPSSASEAASASADGSVGGGGGGRDNWNSSPMMRPPQVKQEQLANAGVKGGVFGQGALLLALVFPVMVVGAIFWVWKQSKKDQRRSH